MPVSYEASNSTRGSTDGANGAFTNGTGTPPNLQIVGLFLRAASILSATCGASDVIRLSKANKNFILYRFNSTANASFFWSGTYNLVIWDASFFGAHPSTPLSDVSYSSISSGTVISAPSVTPTTPGSILVCGCMAESLVTPSLPSGMTNMTSGSYLSVGNRLAYEKLTDTSATGTRAFSLSSSTAATAFSFIVNAPAPPQLFFGSEF